MRGETEERKGKEQEERLREEEPDRGRDDLWIKDEMHQEPIQQLSRPPLLASIYIYVGKRTGGET